jgi:hypothetical protein
MPKRKASNIAVTFNQECELTMNKSVNMMGVIMPTDLWMLYEQMKKSGFAFARHAGAGRWIM